jgi:hypothetical protein
MSGHADENPKLTEHRFWRKNCPFRDIFCILDDPNVTYNKSAHGQQLVALLIGLAVSPSRS